jgi:hypothetical protein
LKLSHQLFIALILILRLTPEEFDVKEVYRFGGDAPGEDEQVLYLITSLVGVKGGKYPLRSIHSTLK